MSESLLKKVTAALDFSGFPSPNLYGSEAVMPEHFNEAGFSKAIYLAICGGIDPVVVNTSFVPERDGQLSWAALAFPNKEAAVNEAAEQILSCTTRHWSMIPGMLLQAVHWGDVVTWHPPLPVLRADLTPFTILVVTQHT